MSIPTFPDRRASPEEREPRLLALAFTFLTLSSFALALSPVVRQADWQAVGDRLGHFILLPVWAGCAWLAHRVLNRHLPGRDPFLLPLALLLAGWGALSIWRLLPQFGARQVSWLLVGTVLLVEICRRPDDLRWLKRYRYVWLIAGTTVTALTLVFGTNPSGGSPQLWLGCCGLYFQPSELLRLLLVAFLASFTADRIAHKWQNNGRPLLPTIVPLLIVWAVSIALLAVQRDMGTGILFVGLLASLIYLVSGRTLVMAAALLVMALGGWIASSQVSLVQIRMDAWLQPWDDPTGNAYQLIQGLMAIASGGIVGRGPGLGQPGFVPASHTDYIFAAITEEWGLIGGLALVALLALLVHRGLRAAAQAHAVFGFVLAAGVSLMFGLQAVLILGGVLRLLPLTGVTVPFVSYGGSSLLTSFVGLALLIHVSAHPGTPLSGRQQPLQWMHKAMLGAFVALTAAAGWWVLVRGQTLVNRTDNPRRAAAQRISPRGSLFDRRGVLLAETVGERGSYTRRVYSQASAPVTGFDSIAFGQSGVEALMDRVLRGLDGQPAVEVWWSKLLTGAPPAGLDVQLTIDAGLQTLTQDLLGSTPGAVVVLRSDTGGILALQTSPSLDPNRLDEQAQELLSRQDAPLLNRATQSGYQPGPLIAPLLYAVGYPDFQTPLPAGGHYGESVGFPGGSRSCALPVGAGTELELGVGLRLGCPAAAVQIGSRVGVRAWEEMIDTFRLDQRLGISSDTLISSLWEPTTADLQREAIGQGQITVSPLQIARAYAALFNGGRMPTPHSVSAVAGPDGSWQPVVIPGAEQVLEIESARATAQLLSGTHLRWGYVYGSAVRGSESKLAWFVGAGGQGAAQSVVVVVLEGGGAGRARQTGETILRWLEQASLDRPPSPG